MTLHACETFPSRLANSNTPTSVEMTFCSVVMLPPVAHATRVVRRMRRIACIEIQPEEWSGNSKSSVRKRNSQQDLL
jgi:hypothetical protein